MPQFDIFAFFNNSVYFFVLFISFYVFMVRVLMPKVLKVLKLRKQKVEYLNNINWLATNRLNVWNSKFFNNFQKVVSFNKFYFVKYGDKKDSGANLFK